MNFLNVTFMAISLSLSVEAGIKARVGSENLSQVLGIDALDRGDHIPSRGAPNLIKSDRVIVHRGQLDLDMRHPLRVGANLHLQRVSAAREVLRACHRQKAIATKLFKDCLGNGHLGHVSLLLIHPNIMTIFGLSSGLVDGVGIHERLGILVATPREIGHAPRLYELLAREGGASKRLCGALLMHTPSRLRIGLAHEDSRSGLYDLVAARAPVLVVSPVRCIRHGPIGIGHLHDNLLCPLKYGHYFSEVKTKKGMSPRELIPFARGGLARLLPKRFANSGNSRHIDHLGINGKSPSESILMMPLKPSSMVTGLNVAAIFSTTAQGTS